MSSTPTDFLLGGGGASAKFEAIGDSVTGTVTNQDVRQQTDIKTGEPITWSNGDPAMQLVVTLQTTLKDDDDDDGLRNLYVKGSKKAGSKSLHDAVASAVRAAGAKGLEDGGTLTVTFVGEEPSQTRGFNPRKLYTATYKAPAAASRDFFTVVEPGKTYDIPDPTGQAAYSVPAATPAAPSVTPEQAAAFAAWQASQNK